MKEIKIKATLLEDMLGTLPGDSQIYREYIACKNPNRDSIDDEAASIDRAIESMSADTEFNKACTVFARDEDNNVCIYDYLVKGFLKNACKAMRECSDSKSKGLSAYKTKIDNIVFVSPRMIKINNNGNISICERPLRASTPQGERIALSASESVNKGSTFEFTVTVLEDKYEDYIYEWLDYGKFNGLGQWHNSGKGRFTYEIVK